MIAKYKASDFCKIRPDLRNLFFLLQVYEMSEIPALVIFDYTW